MSWPYSLLAHKGDEDADVAHARVRARPGPNGAGNIEAVLASLRSLTGRSGNQKRHRLPYGRSSAPLPNSERKRPVLGIKLERSRIAKVSLRRRYSRPQVGICVHSRLFAAILVEEHADDPAIHSSPLPVRLRLSRLLSSTKTVDREGDSKWLPVKQSVWTFPTS